MKSLKNFLVLLAIVTICTYSHNVNAQESNSHIYTATTLKIPIEKMDEFLSNYEKYVTPVIKQNEYVISEKLLTHLWGPDYTVLLMDEYKTWGDIEAADKRYGEISKTIEPDKDKRMEIDKLLSPYYNGHTDAILMEYTKTTK